MGARKKDPREGKLYGYYGELVSIESVIVEEFQEIAVIRFYMDASKTKEVPVEVLKKVNCVDIGFLEDETEFYTDDYEELQELIEEFFKENEIEYAKIDYAEIVEGE